MGYKDEEILKMKKEIKEEQERKESDNNIEKEIVESIYDERVYIFGEPVCFECRAIPELKLSIYMPDNFFLFSEDIKHLVYPGVNAPSHIFGGENINFQMSLNQTSHIVPDSGMKKFLDISAELLRAAGPKVTIIEKNVLEKEDFHIGVMEFVSKAVDMMVYNIQYYISIDEKLLMGGITFPSKYKKRLIPLAKEIINSICLIKED